MKFRVTTTYIVDAKDHADALFYAPWSHPFLQKVLVGTPQSTAEPIEDAITNEVSSVERTRS